MKKPKLEAEENPNDLKPELQETLERVGPEGYARATARDFATGGQFNKTKKPRQALT